MTEPTTIDQATLVIMASADGEKWGPVKPESVPEWVKRPDVMARLVEGEACQDLTAESGETWFCAMTRSDVRSVVAADVKRRVRAEKRKVLLH